MKIRETVSQVMADNEKAFQDIPESRASKLVTLTLQQIAKAIESTAEGRVSVPGLGVFVIKNVEREKDGVKAAVKRIGFRPKAGSADEDGEPAKKKAGAGRSAEDQAARKAAKQAARKEGRKREGGRKAGGNKDSDE